MKTLQVFPTSRAIRHALSSWLENDTLLPQMMPMDVFEQNCVQLGGAAMVDPLQRILLLRQAADFDRFGEFKVDRTLVKFLSGSESFFRFFEELAGEKIEIGTLSQADVYAEFGDHMDILARLRANYRDLLAQKGLTDKMFVPEDYTLNTGFLRHYEKIEIFLEGLLSRFELELLQQISNEVTLHIHYTTTPFSGRMEERFGDVGITLVPDSYNIIDLSAKKLIYSKPHESQMDVKVFSLKERTEQISKALEEIDRMYAEGIPPDRIALILPDESFKESFRLFDKLNNLNFAMGFDYTHGRSYKILQALSSVWRMPDKINKERAERYGITEEIFARISPSRSVDVQGFFEQIEVLETQEDNPLRKARVEEAKEAFVRVLADEQMHVSDWLHLWLNKLSTIRIDDLRGGMVTVMGVLETRGVEFEGVVIVDFNEGIVPSVSAKDQFLNSQVRMFAGLPTKSDREALQKHYYYRLLSSAKRSVVTYAASDHKLPSKFIYELNINEPVEAEARYDLLYDQPSRITQVSDPVVRDFDPFAQTWSANRLKIWLECRRRYYYRYIKGIQPKQEDEPNEGAILHTALYRLYAAYDHYVQADVLRRKLHMIIDELLTPWGAKGEYYGILWRQMLEPFVRQQIDHFERGWRVSDCEREYRGSIYGLEFVGRIDRIDARGDEYMVVDYKTGKLNEPNRSKNLEKTTDFQMNVYRHLLREKYPNAMYAFQKILENGELVEAAAMEEKEEYLKKHLEELAATREFAAQKTDKLSRCTYCPYALICGRGEYL